MFDLEDSTIIKVCWGVWVLAFFAGVGFFAYVLGPAIPAGEFSVGMLIGLAAAIAVGAYGLMLPIYSVLNALNKNSPAPCGEPRGRAGDGY